MRNAADQLKQANRFPWEGVPVCHGWGLMPQLYLRGNRPKDFVNQVLFEKCCVEVGAAFAEEPLDSVVLSELAKDFFEAGFVLTSSD